MSAHKRSIAGKPGSSSTVESGSMSSIECCPWDYWSILTVVPVTRFGGGFERSDHSIWSLVTFRFQRKTSAFVPASGQNCMVPS